ncbi:MAG: UxaA family hydrolase [Halodesulfurarchaeum sp.]
MNGDVIGDVALVMSEKDTVATALDDLSGGRTVPSSSDGSIELKEPIQFGHKFALVPIEAGEDVYKYGDVIGRATREIEPGEWVHTHNVDSTRGRGDVPEGDENGGVA